MVVGVGEVGRGKPGSIIMYLSNSLQASVTMTSPSPYLNWPAYYGGLHFTHIHLDVQYLTHSFPTHIVLLHRYR